jgi:hypothetical protein
MANKENAFTHHKPAAKPEMVRPQQWSDNTPRATGMKSSLLDSVNKQIVFNESGRKGGS